MILVQAKAGVLETQAARWHSSEVAAKTLQVWCSPHSSAQTGIIRLQMSGCFGIQTALAQLFADCGMI
jgi:hypothetical protein